MELKKLKKDLIEIKVNTEEYKMLMQGLSDTVCLGWGPGLCVETYDTTREDKLWDVMDDFYNEELKEEV